jgi:hypothetical protein
MDFDIAARNGVRAAASWIIPRAFIDCDRWLRDTDKEGYPDEQSRGQQGHIVGRWFTEFWGKTCNLGVVDELAAPDMQGALRDGGPKVVDGLAGLPKSLAKCGKVGGRLLRRARAHEPDHRHCRLLRARRERPRCRSAAERR